MCGHFYSSFFIETYFAFSMAGFFSVNAAMAPRMPAIQRIWRAAVRPQISAAQPTMGAKMPPNVVESPRVTPEAKPAFLPR